MSQMQSPQLSNSVSPNIRNFKELYQIKYQEKQQHASLQASQLISSQGQQQPSTPVSAVGLLQHTKEQQQYQQQLQQQQQSLGASNLLNPSSPSSGSIKFPSFSATQKPKLFMNNTNILPKKVTQKAKMISLNLQNASQNTNQSARSGEHSSSSSISMSVSQNQTGHSHHGSVSSGLGFPSPNSVNRHQSYQSPTANSASSTPVSSGFLSKQPSNHLMPTTTAGTPNVSSSNNLGNHTLQPQIQSSAIQPQQSQQQPHVSGQLFTSSRHRGSAGSYAGLFNHTNHSNSSANNPNAANPVGNSGNSLNNPANINSSNSNSSNSNLPSNGNSTDKEQKRYEQYQLLEKYKGTPFLNYMLLNQQSSTPGHTPNNIGFLKEMQQVGGYSQSMPQSLVSSTLHSRNQSQNVIFSQQQLLLEKQANQAQQAVQAQSEKRHSSRIENKSMVSAVQSPSNNGSQQQQQQQQQLLQQQQQLQAQQQQQQQQLLQQQQLQQQQNQLLSQQYLQGSNNGQNSFDASKQDQLSSTRFSNALMNKNSFNYQYVIGKGGFGKVWRVEHKKNKQPYAMKEMSKSKIITKRSVNSVMSERHLLSQLKHPFLVNMNFAFQDRDNLYLVMDLVSGGDLRFHIGRHRRFKEPQTKFFIACIVLSLEYLHSKNVIHRDIKPENLVLDTDGYVKVTDLGVARIWKPDNSQDTSGTPGYMAPEVMCRQNHGIAVDYFAVGIIAYEFMMGRRPYLGRNRKEIRDQILSKQVQIKKHEIPDGWSIEAADFINRMIQRKPVNRLGVNGPEEVKSHPWIKNFPWDKLLNRQLEAPFIPQAIEDNYDYRQQISADGEDTNEELIQQNAILLRKNSVQNLFAGYNYDANEPQRQLSLAASQMDGFQQGSLQSSSSPINYQTGSTHSTSNTNIPSDRSQSALNARKTPSSFA